MKRILLTIALIAVFAVPASAQVFSLWGDLDQTACDAYSGGGAYYTYHVYVFVEPAPVTGDYPAGSFGAEYMLIPIVNDSFLAGGRNMAIGMPVTMGDWVGGAGISIGFDACYAGTLWLYHVEVTNKFDQTPGNWELAARPSDPYGKTAVARCDGPHTKVSASIYNHFGFNQGCTIGTKETSWGAIKSMY
jgi:hypothetical protein